MDCANSAIGHQFECGDSDCASYRQFDCGRCCARVFICSRCDRGNWYCPGCAPIQRAARLTKAQKKYRQSTRGKERRRLAALVHRIRQKSPVWVGDHGSAQAEKRTISSSSAKNAEKGDRDEDCLERKVSTFEESSLRCTFCHRPCTPFRRKFGSPPMRRRRQKILGGSS